MDIIRLETVDSTNTYAKRLAKEGVPHGTVILADHQTGGRGRMGRSFSSPKGLGIYCSVILRPEAEPSQLLHLTPMMAEAVRRAVLEATGLSAQIKWVNDLVINGRKLCGILTEMGLNGTKTDFVVVGVGINCNQKKEDFPAELQEIATSLSMELGKEIDRETVINALLRQIQIAFDCLLTPQDWMEAYRQNCITLGKEVQIIRGEEVRQGFAEDMDDTGALLIRPADGSLEKVDSGEVSVRGLYGYL